MPALPNAPGVVKYEFLQTFAGRQVVNIMHTLYGGSPGSVAEITSVAADAWTAWTTNISPQVNSGVVLTEVRATDLTSNTAPRGVHVANHAGGGGGTALTANAALVGSWQIARRYRGGHPRIYIAGCQTDWLTDVAHWTNTVIANMQTALTGLMNDLAAISHAPYTGMSVVSVSYFSGHALRVTPENDLITGVVVHPRVDSQRRRLGKETTI